MLICAAGDIHGAIDRMYEDVLAFEVALGVRFERHRRGVGWVSEAAGLDRLVAGVRCISLNKVRMPGHLVAIDFNPRGRQWSILGEWPERREVSPATKSR